MLKELIIPVTFKAVFTKVAEVVVTVTLSNNPAADAVIKKANKNKIAEYT